MADGYRASAAMLILCAGAAYGIYNLVPKRTPAAEKNPGSSQASKFEVNNVQDGGQCSGVLKLVQRSMSNTITLIDDFGADCTIGETKKNRELVLRDCEEDYRCAVVGQVRPYKRSDDTKGLHVFVNEVFLAMQLRNRLPQPEQQSSSPSKPAESVADTKTTSDEGK
ncbi:hypothetical protein ACVWWG_003825 [Bradyrhizobium sp. LB7.2]